MSVKYSHQSLTLKTLINVHFPFTAEFAYKSRHFVFGFHYLSSRHVKGEGSFGKNYQSIVYRYIISRETRNYSVASTVT